MKKIMFNDKFGLTQAVLEGKKTQTRRIVPQSVIDKYSMMEDFTIIDDARYDVGEVVAVAQSYRDCDGINEAGVPIWEIISTKVGGTNAGWSNKRFVRADLMPHQIRITDVCVERLQDISDEDCLAEGIVVNEPKVRGGVKSYYPCQCLKECVDKIGWGRVYATPREAYADLIDKVSGNGTWEINPWVWAYGFELVK